MALQGSDDITRYTTVIVTLISTHWVLVTIPTPQPTQRMSTLQGRR
jgi:hypothetical protein